MDEFGASVGEKAACNRGDLVITVVGLDSGTDAGFSGRGGAGGASEELEGVLAVPFIRLAASSNPEGETVATRADSLLNSDSSASGSGSRRE